MALSREQVNALVRAGAPRRQARRDAEAALERVMGNVRREGKTWAEMTPDERQDAMIELQRRLGGESR